MNERTTIVPLILASALVFAASSCGSSVSDNLFGQSSSAGAGGASTGMGGGASTGAGQGGASTGSSMSSAGGSQGGGGSTGQATSSSLSSSGSGGGGGGGVDALPCGDVSCPVGGQNACCWDEYQLNGPPQGACVNAPSSSDNCKTETYTSSGYESRIQCRIQAHCTSGICCGYSEPVQTPMGLNKWYPLVSCLNECPWPLVVMCDPQDPSFVCPLVPNSNNTLVQGVCKPSPQLPSGYFVCVPP